MYVLLRLPSVYKVEWNIHVYIPSPDIRNHFGNHNPALGFSPAHDLAQEAECVGFYAHRHVLALVAADLLELRVLGPGSNGYLCTLLAHCADWFSLHVYIP